MCSISSNVFVLFCFVLFWYAAKIEGCWHCYSLNCLKILESGAWSPFYFLCIFWARVFVGSAEVWQSPLNFAALEQKANLLSEASFGLQGGLGSGPVLWIYTGRKTPLPSTSLPVVGEKLVSTRHHWADIFIVRRQGPDGRKDSTMNSTATCSTWRGMGLSLIHIWRCRRICECRSRWSPYH